MNNIQYIFNISKKNIISVNFCPAFGKYIHKDIELWTHR